MSGTEYIYLRKLVRDAQQKIVFVKGSNLNTKHPRWRRSSDIGSIPHAKYFYFWIHPLKNIATNIHKIHTSFVYKFLILNPLNPELNPICYLLALLGGHHFLHVSRIRVKLLTFRLLMSYMYGAPILDVSRSHTTTQHSR